MKQLKSLNVERKATEEIKAFLAGLPNLTNAHVVSHGIAGEPDDGIDIVVDSRFAGKPLRLIIEVKNNGQPRTVRNAAAQLHRYMRNHVTHAVPVVVAPYLSRQARDVCREEGVGYLDFMGNAFIASDSIYIERELPGQPEPERRALRSLYKPKSARVLRRLLREPGRGWRTAELAHAAGVSIGLVSNVGAALRERTWAEQTNEGLSLTDPNALLDSWSENYEPPRGEEFRLYTSLHGPALTERLRKLAMEDGRVALASFSAAQWLAPFVRHPNTYFYADEAGLDALGKSLEAKLSPKGANVIVVIPEEHGVLDDATCVAEDIVVTSPVQTYLDLVHSGDRGEEGAAELRRRLLDWPA
ncbi:type IV toxin-antitoxin system AbiEi family antitoxin [Sphingomonas sp. GCM10030256]|uniref:type IV toxin-antitoxin system AbiEi family antitoxin n=1 Tax=Sphingomonas sp. GCM10030256 TaxID=3273427 RepID=UPI00360B72E9